MHPKEYLLQKINHWENSGYLTLVWALLFEMLLFGFLGFAGLYTLEVLLPTFITARISLTKVFFFLLLGISLLAWIGAKLNLEFPKHSPQKSPLIWMVLIWSIALLLISMIKLPLWSIPIFLTATIGIILLFSKLSLAKDDQHQTSKN